MHHTVALLKAHGGGGGTWVFCLSRLLRVRAAGSASSMNLPLILWRAWLGWEMLTRCMTLPTLLLADWMARVGGAAEALMAMIRRSPRMAAILCSPLVLRLTSTLLSWGLFSQWSAARTHINCDLHDPAAVSLKEPPPLLYASNCDVIYTELEAALSRGAQREYGGGTIPHASGIDLNYP